MTHPTVKLGDVAQFIRGITFKPDDVVPVDAHDAVVCMRTKNVQATLDCDDLLAVPSHLVRRKDQFLYEGDILVSSANSWNLVGKCCWVPALPWRAAFGGFISVLRGDPTRVNRRYLYWWLASERVQALLRSFGQKTTSISNLNIERCLQLELPLPEIAEQQRIAAFLDKADALRIKRHQALTQLDKLEQSIFVDMFGPPAANPLLWPIKSLKEVGRISTGGTPPSSMDGMFGGDIPFVTPGDLESSRPVRRTVTESGASTVGTVRAGAALICCIGATIGKIGQATVRSAFNQQLNAVEWFENEVDDAYGITALRFFKPTIIAWGTSTTLPILKKSSFEKLSIPIPPISLQRAYAQHIQMVGRLEVKNRAALEKCIGLFSSLQNQAFLKDI